MDDGAELLGLFRALVGPRVFAKGEEQMGLMNARHLRGAAIPFGHIEPGVGGEPFLAG